MTLVFLLLVLAGCALAAPLPLLASPGAGRRAARVVLHVISFMAFGAAGWLIAREGRSGAAWIVVLGFVVVGAAWLAAVRRRILEFRGARLLHPHETPPAVLDGDPMEAGERLEPMGRELLMRLLTLRELPVRAIATPRERIVHADLAAGVAGALEKIRASGYLRILMVDGSLDRVVGVVHAKDILRLDGVEKGAPPLKSLMRRALFVGAESSAANLLEQFRIQRSHLAVVVDAFSRTVGVVTRDDLFRHLSGGVEPGR